MIAFSIHDSINAIDKIILTLKDGDFEFNEPVYNYDVIDITKFIEYCHKLGINILNFNNYYCVYKNIFEILEQITNMEMKEMGNCFVSSVNGVDVLKNLKHSIDFYVSSSSPNEITDVNVIVPDKVVEVTFADGTKEKSVCREPDVFSMEQAIAICIGKKLMGGSGAYNGAIRRGIKVYENKLEKEKADKAEQERIEKRRAKREAYKARKNAKRENAEKERQIEIQKEAYIRAMEFINKYTDQK